MRTKWQRFLWERNFTMSGVMLLWLYMTFNWSMSMFYPNDISSSIVGVSVSSIVNAIIITIYLVKTGYGDEHNKYFNKDKK